MVPAIVPSERDTDDARRAIQLLRTRASAGRTVMVQGADSADPAVRAESPVRHTSSSSRSSATWPTATPSR